LKKMWQNRKYRTASEMGVRASARHIIETYPGNGI